MSWKSLVTAGLFCVLASPVFAAPSVTITNAGLNAQGDWLWNVQISNSNPVPSGSSALAAELGFTLTNAALKNVTNTDPANFDTSTPGTKIFGWETDYGTPLKPEGIEVDCTGCTVTNATVFPTTAPHPSTIVAGTLNQVFAALGSGNFTTVGPHNFISITTKGPTAASASAPTSTRKTVIQMSGAYGGNGRVAELTGATTATNYDTFAGTQFAVATPGDTNLVGGVDLTDFNTVLDNFGIGQFWQKGNFHGNGTGTTDLSDFNTVLDAFGKPSGGTGSGSGPGAGAGLGAGGAVPEPGTLALIALGFAGLLSARRRK